MSRAKTALAPFFGGKVDDIDYEVNSDHESNYSDTQNSNGAPVESVNPLGYNLDYVTTFYMVIQGVIGTGIFATPATIVKSMGSIGSTYVLWTSGFIIVLFEVFVYIEYVTYFKKRNGGDVAYLEQAYPKPDFMIPTTYAAVSICLLFLNSSAIAFGTYVLSAAGVEASAWGQRGVGMAVLSFACILAAINTKWSLRLSNFLGFVKVVFLFFIVITGFVVLGGNTRIQNPHEIFKNAWQGTTSDGNAISNAILKVSFSFGGTQYVFSLVGETNPRQTKNVFRFFVPGVLFFIYILYICIITSYYSAFESAEEIGTSSTLVASAFFARVFGTKSATKALDIMVALSAFGHLLAAVVGHSRALRECGRQGVLPYSKLWTSTKPWGTPLLPIFITWLVNLIVSIAPPPGDAYNFIVDMGSYSSYIFKLLLVVGLLLVRKQRKEAGLGYQGWKVPMPILIIIILYEIFVVAMAFVPPADGSLIGSDVSFFYCTYALTTIGIIGLCISYYYIWAKILPRFYNYEHRIASFTLQNGEQGHTVVKVAAKDVAQWDLEHTSDGKLVKPDSNNQTISHTSDCEYPTSVENISISVTDNKQDKV